MFSLKKTICLILIISFFLFSEKVFAVQEKVEGLEYTFHRVDDFPVDRYIKKKYDLYELYIENNSLSVFSIPGYSIDIGAANTELSTIKEKMKARSSKQLAILNVATDAASFALGGGVAKGAARATFHALQKVQNKKNKNSQGSDEVLSQKNIYILYPGDSQSIFFFVDKTLVERPNTIRFLCKDEEKGISHVIVNSMILIDDFSTESYITVQPVKEVIDISLVEKENEKKYYAMKEFSEHKLNPTRINEKYVELSNLNRASEQIATPVGREYY